MNGVYKTIGTTLIYAASLLGCKAIAQQSGLEARADKTKVEAFEKSVSDEKNAYASAAGNPTKQLAHIKSRLEEVMKDGVVNPATAAYETNEVFTVKEQYNRAKAVKETLKGDDAVTKALRGEAEALENKANGYLKAFKGSNQLKLFYVFTTEEGKDAYWYFEKPGKHAALKATPQEIADGLGISVDELVDKMQSSYGDKFGDTPSRAWSQAQLDALKARVLENAVRVPTNKLKQMVKYFPDGKLTNGNDTISADEYKSWKVSAGYIFTVPTKVDGKKETTLEDKYNTLKAEVDAIRAGKKEAPKEVPKETPKEVPKEVPKVEAPKETPKVETPAPKKGITDFRKDN